MFNSKIALRYARVLDRVEVCALSFVLCFLICSSGVTAQTAESASVKSETAKAETAPIADKWAVVIGVSKYSDKKISLPSGASDAQKFAKFLTTKGNFAPDHVKVLLDSDATRTGILTVLGRDWLPRVAGPNDLVVVYIRAAGSPSELDYGGINYALPADAQSASLFSTGVALQHVPRVIEERTHARQLVVIADTDYSAGLLKDNARMQRFGGAEPQRDTLSVAACGKDQRSCEEKTEGGSIFTKRLIEALQMNGAETRFASAFQQLTKNVQSDAQQSGKEQTPEIKSAGAGDIVLLAKPSAPRAVPAMESQAD